MKINTKKFTRNIIVCLIAFYIVSLILNYAPGFKRNKFEGVTNLIINDKNLTEELEQKIYVDNNNIYLSKEDIKKFFDKNIYYDEENNVLITTSNTKTASIVIGENKMKVNGVEQELKAKAFRTEETIYVPISDLSLIYNISINYANETNIVVIDRLNSGLIKAEVEEDAVIKFKPRKISKKVGKVQKGEKISCYYTTSKGWRLIRKEDGTLGYVKANILGQEYIVRQDFNDEIKTSEITTSLKNGSTLSLYNNNRETTKIVIKTLFNLESNGTIKIDENEITSDYKIWATVSNEGLEKQTNELIANYQTRTQLIDTLVNYISKYRIYGLNIDFRNVSMGANFNRFVIELAPRLRELGITTNIVLNDSFNESEFVGIVDYLIIEKEI